MNKKYFFDNDVLETDTIIKTVKKIKAMPYLYKMAREFRLETSTLIYNIKLLIYQKYQIELYKYYYTNKQKMKTQKDILIEYLNQMTWE